MLFIFSSEAERNKFSSAAKTVWCLPFGVANIVPKVSSGRRIIMDVGRMWLALEISNLWSVFACIACIACLL